MRKILFISFFLISTLSFAQSEKEVETAVEKLRFYLLEPSEEALKQLTTKDLTYGHSSGLIENQAEFIEALVSGKTDFKSIDLSNQSIIMNGKNLAFVRHNLKGEVASAGQTNAVNLGVLLVWVKEKGNWKLAARQAFKI